MDLLHPPDRMRDGLLGHTRGHAGQAQENGLDGVVRTNDIDGAGVIQPGLQDRGEQVGAAEVAVVHGHEAVIRLGLDELERHEEEAIAERVLEAVDAEAGKDAAGADLAEFLGRVGPHVGVPLRQDVARSEPDAEGVQRGG